MRQHALQDAQQLVLGGLVERCVAVQPHLGAARDTVMDAGFAHDFLQSLGEVPAAARQRLHPGRERPHVALHAGDELAQPAQPVRLRARGTRGLGCQQPLDADELLADAVVQVEGELFALELGGLDRGALERGPLAVRPERGEPAVLLHDHGREDGGEAEQLALPVRRRLRPRVVERDRPEHFVGRVVEERHGPAGAQAVGQRQMPVITPERRHADVPGGHGLAAPGGRTAAAGAVADRDLAEPLDVLERQARCRDEHQHVASRIAQQDRAVRRRRPGFDVAGERIEQHGQGRVGSEQHQQPRLRTERPAAERGRCRGDIREAIGLGTCREGGGRDDGTHGVLCRLPRVDGRARS